MAIPIKFQIWFVFIIQRYITKRNSWGNKGETVNAAIKTAKLMAEIKSLWKFQTNKSKAFPHINEGISIHIIIYTPNINGLILIDSGTLLSDIKGKVR